MEVVLGREIDDHRHVSLMTDAREVGEGDLPVLHAVMADDVEAGRSGRAERGS
jgi:hypothetical protein